MELSALFKYGSSFHWRRGREVAAVRLGWPPSTQIRTNSSARTRLRRRTLGTGARIGASGSCRSLIVASFGKGGTCRQNQSQTQHQQDSHFIRLLCSCSFHARLTGHKTVGRRLRNHQNICLRQWAHPQTTFKSINTHHSPWKYSPTTNSAPEIGAAPGLHPLRILMKSIPEIFLKF